MPGLFPLARSRDDPFHAPSATCRKSFARNTLSSDLARYVACTSPATALILTVYLPFCLAADQNYDLRKQLDEPRARLLERRPMSAVQTNDAAWGGNFYFHIGMCKTATTFMQNEVFPRWPGINYLKSRNLEYFLLLKENEKYLISCEGFTGRMFGTIEEKCQSVYYLSRMFKDSNIIISVRRHGGYLGSLYSQYLRYGGHGDMADFIDLTGDRDRAFIRCRDFCFEPVIRAAELAFGKSPFVFDMAELSTNFDGLLQDLAAFLQTPVPSSRSFGQEPKNFSLKHWQGQLLRRVNRAAGVEASRSGRLRPYRGLVRWRLDPPTICRRYLGCLPSRPLVDKTVRDQIDQTFAADWKFVSDYIKALPYRRS